MVETEVQEGKGPDTRDDSSQVYYLGASMKHTMSKCE